MKKLIAIAVVLALVSGVAFAQTAPGISVEAWGRAAFSPLKYVSEPRDSDGNIKPDKSGNDEKAESYSGVGATWGGGLPRIDFRINGSSDYVGFNTQFGGEGGVSILDNLHIWAKPLGSDVLKLTAGKIADDTLRGKIGNLDDGFSNLVLPYADEEDAIFTRFSTWATGSSNSDYGWMISSAPIDGLYLGLVVSGVLDGDDPLPTYADHAYRFMQIGAGYNIANIGHIRAQYIGGWAGDIDLDDEDTARYFFSDVDLDDPDSKIKLARIEAAFALTAVEGLLVDVGVKIGVPGQLVYGSEKRQSASSGFGFSLGGTFNAGAFGIGARIDASKFGAYFRPDKDDKSEEGSLFVFRVVPTFDLGGVTVGLDVALAAGGESKTGSNSNKDGWSQFGFGAFVSKGLGSGTFKAGLSYTGAKSYSNNDYGKGQFESGVFQIPVILQYSFF